MCHPRFPRRRRGFNLTLIATMGVALLAFNPCVRGQTRIAQSGPTSVPPAQPAAGHSDAAARFAVRSGRLPLSFEANRGQADYRVKFLSRGPGYTLFLTGSEALLALRANSNPLIMRLAGANPVPNATGLDELPGKSNYLLGGDPNKWRRNVPNYARVRYQNVYPGIDLVYYGNQGRLEYDFVVAPGADPAAIAISFAGAQPASVDPRTGDLVVGAAREGIRFLKPVVYQTEPAGGGSRAIIEGRYKVGARGRIRFDIAAYDHAKPLIIDPALSYSTYFGGSLDDTGRGLALDSDGNVYLTGSTCSANLPVVNGFQQTYGGDGGHCSDTNGGDAFVAKFSPTLSTLLYSTYLGGTGDDSGDGIAVDSSGDAYVTGSTCSGTSFPITPGAFQTIYGGGSKLCEQNFGDAFVTELNPSGSALVYSTFLGGSGADMGNAILLDASNNAYVLGTTCSANFPITAGAFQTTYDDAGTQCYSPTAGDAFMTKLNSTGTALIYSTYLGGSEGDIGWGLTLDSLDDAYVVGQTYSSNFPTTAGAFQTTCLGCSKSLTEAFVTMLNPSGTALIYSTYLGGSSGVEPCAACATGIAIDSSGDAYVSGLTSDATDFPLLNAYQSIYGGGGHDAFVTEFNPAGSALVYSTFLGGKGDDGATAIALDTAGNAYIRGNTASTNYPTTQDAFQGACSGGCKTGDYDFFLSELTPEDGLLYSTYLGGTLNDFGKSTQNLILSTAAPPMVYITGYSNSTNFPVTIDAYQQASGGGYDAVLTEFTPGSNVTLNPTTLSFGDQNVGTSSTAMNITLENNGQIALTISSIKIAGADSHDFSQTNTCGSSVPALQDCTISVTFSPTETGQRKANVSIKDNGGGSPQEAFLSGFGTQ